MEQPLLPFGVRLRNSMSLGGAWFLLLYLTSGRNAWGAILGLLLGGVHFAMYFGGPNARRVPAKPERSARSPIWVERNEDL